MSVKIGILLLTLLVAANLHAAGATLRLFAGGGTRVTGPATECRLADPFATDFDAPGNTYICEMTNNRVLKVDSRGNLTVFAGTTKKGGAGDGGPATEAELNGPHHLIVAKNGDVFIADTWNWRIRRIDAKNGIISTIAGTGKRGYSGDGGPAKEADFSGVYSLAFDTAEENLYVADLENRRVRAVEMKTGKVRLIAGNGQKEVPADGSNAIGSPLFDPRAVAVAKSGDVYILERGGHAMRVVDTKGRIRTVVGTGKAGGVTSMTEPLQVTLKGPKHLWVDRDDTVLIVDSENDVIRRYIPRENKIVLVAGTGKRGSTLNRDPLKTELRHPHGVNVDAQGRIYISDSNNSRVLRIE
jgi:DNA-binding beta-propeller fold protein YncE